MRDAAFALALLLTAASGEPRAQVAPPPPTAEEKIARAMKLEYERSLGNADFEALLADPDDRVRARATLALGRLGGPEDRLASLLSDISPYVKATAAFSIGILEGPIAPETVSRLTEALFDESARVRGRVAEALARRQGAAAAETLGAALSRWIPRGGEPYDWGEEISLSSVTLPHPDVRGAILGLGLEPGSTRFAWDAVATEGSTPRFLWWPAAWLSSELSGEELEPLHLFYAGSPDPVLRLYGARGLGNASAATLERARAQLRSLLFDPSEQVRIEAIRAAARTGASDLVPDLLSHLEADTRYVQSEILSALRRLSHEAAVEPLVDRLGDSSPWIRALALAALAGQDPETFWLLLSGVGSDNAWEVRRALADLFASLEGERPQRLLKEMVEDPDARVRAAALRSLARVSASEETKRIAIRHLGGPDPFERVAAASALAAIGANDAFPPLEQAFLEEKDEDPRIRAALLTELYALDRVKVSSLAERALDDPSYFVRRTAASLLAGLGLDRSLRPRSSERGLQEYVDIVTMPYSPTAFIDTSRGRLEVELFIADAPQTVLNFIRLAREGFYAGTPFHDVLPNGHVAGGDPRGDGKGGPGYAIGSEINERPFVRGTLVLDEDEGRDSGGSRFVILHLPDPKLEGRATAFGLVTSGMDVVDRIEPGDVIEKVTIWDGVTSPYEGQ